MNKTDNSQYRPPSIPADHPSAEISADLVALYARCDVMDGAHDPLQFTVGERMYFNAAIVEFSNRIDAMAERLAKLEHKLKFKGR